MRLDLVVKMIDACGKLKRLTLHLYGYSHGFDLNTLDSAFLSKKDTLEHIEMVIEQSSSGGGIVPLSSLAGLRCLKPLHIPEVILLGVPDDYFTAPPQMFFDSATDTWERGTYEWTTFRPPHRLSALLPISIEVLYVDGIATHLSDNSGLLWDFIDDLVLLPQLRAFGTRSDRQGPFDGLFKEFASRGVDFRTT
jgi:hypothetical protein